VDTGVGRCLSVECDGGSEELEAGLPGPAWVCQRAGRSGRRVRVALGWWGRYGKGYSSGIAFSELGPRVGASVGENAILAMSTTELCIRSY
jgi:hypothetical protein